MAEAQAALRTKYQVLFRHLDERQRRLVVAADAERLGRGGVSMVAQSSGLSRATVHKALRELHERPLVPGRVRKSGGGRKRTDESDPSIVENLERLIEPAT